MEHVAAYLSQHINAGKKGEHRGKNPETETKSNDFCEVQIAGSEEQIHAENSLLGTVWQ